ncbi:MAG: branched-chain amino acid ABC transporter ATP-binding protein/permease [Acidimicrobiaceae bacterium]|nr:branched-chain amino acid ABC transporter ATP-binding protein/permease [Acidimicrobiaceae bacterium]
MRRALATGAACAFAAAVFSGAFGGYRSGQLSLFLVFAALAVSLDFVWGYSGILSLGQLLPFGIAAYTSAKVATAAPSLSVPMLIVAAGVGAGVAAALGVAMLRRRPSAVVVGLLTLVLSLTLEQLAEQWRDVTGGFNGLTGVPRLGAFGSELSDTAQDVAVSMLAIVAITLVGTLLTRPIGAVLIGIRSNERRMEALGYKTVQIKIWAFTVGGALAGFAGALYVHRTSFVSPQIFGFSLATSVVLWTLVGGRGTIVGPVVGAIAINFASATLADVWLQYWTLATGLIFVAVVMVMPHGLVPSAQRLAGRPLRRRHQPVLRSAANGAAATSGAGDEAPSAVTAAIFEVRHVHKSFGFFRLLDGVTLTMEDAELRCLIGPNGAGKSTLLDILSGQQGCQSGRVLVLGTEHTGRQAWEFARHGVSRKFQSPQLIDDLSVATNVAIAAWGARSSPWALIRRPWATAVPRPALEVLERTQLGERLDMRAGDLSHGDKQWLEIAMAVAGECRLLLLDEPTAGMTVAESLEAAALLRELHRSHRLPIVIVEHDMAFIRAVADRVTVLARGEVIADGTVAEVENDPDVRAIYAGVDS